MKNGIVLLVVLSMISCREENNTKVSSSSSYQKTQHEAKLDNLEGYFVVDHDTTEWTEIVPVKGSIILDLKYGTEDNFTKTKLYTCPRCFLKKDAALAFDTIVMEYNKRGYQVKLFDCYRPRSVQQKMWDFFPNPTYVTNPRNVSMHTRGVAIDMTLCDVHGNELDMGSPFDHFGREAHHDNFNFAPEVIQRKKLLLDVNRKYGFQAIRTEWWHYSYRFKSSIAATFQWKCE